MSNLESKKRPIYVISSVRGISETERAVVQNHVEDLNQSGENEVFDPYRDAPQDDETGLNIILAELEFLTRIAQSGQEGQPTPEGQSIPESQPNLEGRVDILWNPTSEGSRVDFGMAVALNLRLQLVKIFNQTETEIPQVTLELVQEICQLQENGLWPPAENQEISQNLAKLLSKLEEIKNSDEVTVDWDLEMNTSEAEWQRITLGLALGTFANNPDLTILLGKISGQINPSQKSYPRAIQELGSK